MPSPLRFSTSPASGRPHHSLLAPLVLCQRHALSSYSQASLPVSSMPTTHPRLSAAMGTVRRTSPSASGAAPALRMVTAKFR